MTVTVEPDVLTRLILVRHGQSVANVNLRLQGQTPGELTPIGQQQIVALADRVRSFHIDKLISSDLRRAHDTAQAIAKETGLDLHVTTEVREWNIGVLDGEPHGAWVEVVEHSDLPEQAIIPEGGQSLNDLRDRAQRFLDGLVEAHDGQNVMVVCHGDFIRACLRVLLGISFAEASIYRPKNASYSILERYPDDNTWHLTSFSIVDHLEQVNTPQ